MSAYFKKRTYVLYDKSNKGFKQQDVVKNTCNAVARALDFVRNGN